MMGFHIELARSVTLDTQEIVISSPRWFAVIGLTRVVIFGITRAPSAEPLTSPLPIIINEGAGEDKSPEKGSRAIWVGVAVSLFAGLFSALLQYAFVYGAGKPHMTGRRLVITSTSAVNVVVRL
jgi:hypothetical protein